MLAKSSFPIVLIGDLSDGLGKELIERRLMCHHLISAISGDVFFARRFLNHALFDAHDTGRWSVHFQDELDTGRNPHNLLDHILFSQSMTGSDLGTPCALRVRSTGGLVEHEVHHCITSPRYEYAMTSDHKRVSMWFDRRSNGAGS